MISIVTDEGMLDVPTREEWVRLMGWRWAGLWDEAERVAAESPVVVRVDTERVS